ncbi:DUF6301 family protein [Buchananella hordeovulneris]|uniref:DUF6301 family protein n=1 Tax=Buchananella hordeovulneris TaxID=52770 RepID=UPI0026DD3177|nr:DUF6301 family protein [Buchananella hordeovulneris]MDO5080007.1 DUF6301 family protein [Buchananella hordeovulneris]
MNPITAISAPRLAEIARVWAAQPWPLKQEQAIGVYPQLGWAPQPDRPSIFFSDLGVLPGAPKGFFTLVDGFVAAIYLPLNNLQVPAPESAEYSRTLSQAFGPPVAGPDSRPVADAVGHRLPADADTSTSSIWLLDGGCTLQLSVSPKLALANIASPDFSQTVLRATAEEF